MADKIYLHAVQREDHTATGRLRAELGLPDEDAEQFAAGMSMSNRKGPSHSLIIMAKTPQGLIDAGLELIMAGKQAQKEGL